MAKVIQSPDRNPQAQMKKYVVAVADEKVNTIELTGIPMIAMHPGRPNEMAVPLWPLF